MKEKIFEAKDVVVKFNLRGRTLTAIRGASIDLYQGETLAIVGESGSGKSYSQSPSSACWIRTAG